MQLNTKVFVLLLIVIQKITVLLIWLTNLGLVEDGYFSKGLTYYNNRAEGHVGLVAKPEMINKALDCFLIAYKENPTAEVAEYVLRSYYFKGNFTISDKDVREKVFEEGKNFGLKAIAEFPNSAEVLYYHAITYGKWGEHVGLWVGLKEDAADNLKKYFEKVIELDPKAVEAGGHRILAVINYQIPYVPFIVPWPSVDVAEQNLLKAREYFPNNPSNNFFYAECLVKKNREKEAIPVLKKILTMEPRQTFIVEDTWVEIKTKELLAEIEK